MSCWEGGIPCLALPCLCLALPCSSYMNGAREGERERRGVKREEERRGETCWTYELAFWSSDARGQPRVLARLAELEGMSTDDLGPREIFVFAVVVGLEDESEHVYVFCHLLLAHFVVLLCVTCTTSMEGLLAPALPVLDIRLARSGPGLVSERMSTPHDFSNSTCLWRREKATPTHGQVQGQLRLFLAGFTFLSDSLT